MISKSDNKWHYKKSNLPHTKPAIISALKISPMPINFSPLKVRNTLIIDRMRLIYMILFFNTTHRSLIIEGSLESKLSDLISSLTVDIAVSGHLHV